MHINISNSKAHNYLRQRQRHSNIKVNSRYLHNFSWLMIKVAKTRAGDTWGPGRPCPRPPTPKPPYFCLRKRKKRGNGKKERVSKQKLLKGCHQSQNIIVLTIPERLEFENFSCQPTMVADNTFQCSIVSAPLPPPLSPPPTLKSIFTKYQRNRLKKRHSSLFALRELYYHRLFKILNNVCSAISSSNHLYNTDNNQYKSFDWFLCYPSSN